MIEHTPKVILALLVLSAVGLLGHAATSEEYQQRLKQETAEARAYCEQVYGDDDVIVSNTVGRHGGLHCIANEDTPHLHDIPERYQEQALRAEQNGHDLGWTPENAVAHAAEYRHNRPWWELQPMLAMGVVVLGLVMLCVEPVFSRTPLFESIVGH